MPVIQYKVKDDIYDIPEEKAQEFESKYKDASISYSVGDDVYDIPVSQKDAFKGKYKDAQYHIPQSDTPTVSEQKTTEPEKKDGFWDSFAGDLIEKTGGQALNLLGGTFGFLDKQAQNIEAMGLGTHGGMFGDSSKMLNEKAKGLIEKGTRYGDKTFVDLAKEGDYKSAAGDFALEGISMILPQIAAGLATGGTSALGLMGASVYSHKMDQLDEERPDMPEVAKTINSLATGGAEILSENLSLTPMLKWYKNIYKTKGASVAENAVKDGIQGFLAKQYKDAGLLFAPVWEGITEMASQFAENITDRATGADPDKPLSEGVLESFGYGVGGGGVAGSGAIPGLAKNKYDKIKTNRDWRKSREEFTSQFPNEDTKTFINGISSMDPEQQKIVLESMMQDSELSNEQKNAAAKLVESNQAYRSRRTPEAIQQDKEARKELIVQTQMRNYDNAARPYVADNGMIQRVHINGNVETPVYITKGNVAFEMNPEGQLNLNQSESSPELYYADAEGKTQVVSPSQISGIISMNNYAERRSEYENQIRTGLQMQEQASTNNANEPISNGDEVVYMDDTGKEVIGVVTDAFSNPENVMLDNGQTVPRDIVSRTQAEQAPKTATQAVIGELTDENLNESLANINHTLESANWTDEKGVELLAKREEIENEIGRRKIASEQPQPEVANLTQPYTQVENQVETQPIEVEQAPTESIVNQEAANENAEVPWVEESKVSYISQIPVQNGTMMFDQASPEITIGALQEVYDDPAELNEVVSVTINNIQKQLEKAGKLKPTGDINKDIANKQKSRQEIADLQNRMNYWRGIQEMNAALLQPAPIKDQITEQLTGKSTPAKAEQPATIITEKKKSSKPSPFQLRVAKMEELAKASVRNNILHGIASGSYKFSWNDKPGSRGLGAELGLSSSPTERRIRIGILANAGYTPEQLAHRIWEDSGREVNDTEIRNEVLDVLSTVTSRAQALEVLESQAGITEDQYNAEQEKVSEYENEIFKQEQQIIDDIANSTNEEDFIHLWQVAENLGLSEENLNEAYTILDVVDILEQTEYARQQEQANDEGSLHEQGKKAVREGRSYTEFDGTVGERDGSAESASPEGQNQAGETGRIDNLSPEEQRIVDEVNTQLNAEVSVAENRLNDLKKEEKAAQKRLSKAQSETPGDLFAEPKGGNLFDVPADLSKRNVVDAILKPLQDKIALAENEITSLEDSRQGKIDRAISDHRSQGNLFEDQHSEETAFDAMSRIAKEEDIRQAEAAVDTNPTEAQTEAGNYQKGHVTIQDFDVTIENPKGSTRSGNDPNGKEWSITMNNSYGYILGTKSRDGEQIDVFIGPNPNSKNVFVVDQVNEDGSFDEHKVMLGFDTIEEAREAYLSNYEEGWQGLGNITPTDTESFREWAETDGKRIKPFAEYATVRNTGDAVSEPSLFPSSDNSIQTQINWNAPEDHISSLPVDESVKDAREKAGYTDESITFVERQLSEQGNLTFMGDKLTGAAKIKTSADIAFLFKNLESAATENAFAVMINKDGSYSVLYLGSGGTTQAIIDVKQVVAAANELGAERVVLVHNHPSGNLKASRQDQQIHNSLSSALLLNNIKLLDSVIINLDSGKYVEFGTFEDVFDKKAAPEKTIEPKVYQFDRQVLYAPSNERATILSSADAAEFLSKQKRGIVPKIQAIIVGQSNAVNRYLLLDANMPLSDLAGQLIREAGKHGEAVILSSNGVITPESVASIKRNLATASINLLDVLEVKQDQDIVGGYKSFADEGLMEEKGEYKTLPKDGNNGNKNMPEAIEGETILEYAKRISDWWNGKSKEVSSLTKKFNETKLKIAELRHEKSVLNKAKKDLDEKLEKFKTDKQKRAEALMDAESAIEKYIQKNVTKDIAEEMGVGEFQQITSKLHYSESRKDIDDVFRSIDKVTNHIEARRLEKMFKALLKTKVLDKNDRGVSVAKSVDDETRRSMEYINENKDLTEAEIDKRIEQIRERTESGQNQNEDVRTEADLEMIRLLANINTIKGNIRQIKDEIKEEYRTENILPLAESQDEARAARDEMLSEINELESRLETEANPAVIESINAEIDRKKDGVSRQNKLIRTLGREIGKLVNSDRVVLMEKEMINLQEELNDAYKIANAEFYNFLETGKSKLRDFKNKEIDRRRTIGKEAIEAVKSNPILEQGGEKGQSWHEKAKRWLDDSALRDVVMAPQGNLNFMLKYIDKNHPMGEGILYKRFFKSKDGVFQAGEDYYSGRKEFQEEVAKKAEETFGMSFDKIIKDSKQKAGEVNYTDSEGDIISKDMSKGELLYLHMVSKMNDGRVKLEKMGIEENQIQEIENALDPEYISFSEWIQDEFLPKKREKYNATHKDVFGASMAKRDHYFPLQYSKESLREEVDTGEISYGMPSTITGSLINRVRNSRPLDLTANAFDVLMDHGQKMEEWNAYAKVRKDLNGLLSNRYVRNLIDANDPKAHEALKESARVAVRSFMEKTQSAEKTISKISRLVAGGAIAYRLNTALKQVLSYPAFLEYSNSPRYHGLLLRNLSPDVYGKNFRWAKENLPGFSERWESKNLGNEKLSEKSFKLIDDFMDIGMFPNRLIDAMTVVSGSKSIYDHAAEKYQKQGYSTEEADRMAKYDAAIEYNETQQSARAEFLAPLQKSGTLLNRSLTTFQNNNFAYLRKLSEGIYEISRKSKPQIDQLSKEYEREGLSDSEAKGKAEKEVYGAKAKAVKNMLLFGVFMGTTWKLAEKMLYGLWDDDEEKKKDIIAAIATSPLDGVYGISSLANSISEGYSWNPIMLAAEWGKAYDKVMKAAKDEGVFSEAIAIEATKGMMRTAGIDFKTFANMYASIEDAVKNGDWDATNTHYLLNAPASVRKSYASKVRDDETALEYMERVKRAYDSEDQFKKDEKKLFQKKLFSDKDGMMTDFNNLIDDAKKWQKMNDEIKNLRKSGNTKGASEVFNSKEYQELNENSMYYRRALRVSDVDNLVDDVRAYRKKGGAWREGLIEKKANILKERMPEGKD